MNPWLSLETIRLQSAVAAVWREFLGDTLAPFTAAFLKPDPEPARFYPCPRHCGCSHEVSPAICFQVTPPSPSLSSSGGEGRGEEAPIPFSSGPADPAESVPSPFDLSPGSFIALCTCELQRCDPFLLTSEDLVIWELSWSKLARALCRALLLDPKSAEFGLHNTRQIGSWSANATPVILTIPNEPNRLRATITELATRLQKPFALLAPTSRFLDAASQELLNHAHVLFITLDSTVALTAQCTLQAIKPPGELFAQFNPRPQEALHEDTARKAFAMAKALDSEGRMASPTPFTVFCDYCVEGLSAAQIARKHSCSKLTILRRLKLIRTRTGVDPRDLRRLSPHLQNLQHNLADPRAARLNPNRLIYDSDPDDP